MVKIEVGRGDEAEEFLVHKNLICSKVQFFDNVFNGPFREARELRAGYCPFSFGISLTQYQQPRLYCKHKVHVALTKQTALPADDPAAFNLFVDWLYSGGLLRVLVEPTLFETRPYYLVLMKLFYFAEKLFIPVLSDLVMDALIGLGSHFKAFPRYA